ncbi:hypothetical protein EAJ79_23380 [Salmonella enterica]|nr:hypothetical protein [Salmonella enterica]
MTLRDYFRVNKKETGMINRFLKPGLTDLMIILCLLVAGVNLLAYPGGEICRSEYCRLLPADRQL